jgi:dTDP-glucose 4,6-dehydratase
LQRTILVTGGAGFIGSNFVLHRVGAGDRVVNLDKLTYAGNLENLAEIRHHPSHIFMKGGIEDSALVTQLLQRYQPAVVVNFAAESHVDRSIVGPEEFILTNVVGTFRLLDACLKYWRDLDSTVRPNFRYLQVSTDEVYGSLGAEDPAFCEVTPYTPNSPYSASKASADHLVRAYFHTYGLPVLTTNCSNNYGPFQFPEKLIPLMLLNALQGKALPVYGDGLNVRDWLYVEDHCEAISLVLEKGRPGETYNIGGESEKTNIEVVETICSILDELHPDRAPHCALINHVKDRPGHDRRYAVDCSKLVRELGWKRRETFVTGIQKTIDWYLKHESWTERVSNTEYRNWIERNYGGRDVECEA